MRCSTRRAVVGRGCQTCRSVSMTSAVVTDDTGIRPMQGKATRVRPDIQSRPYRGLRQPGRIWLQTRSAASAKVGSATARFSARGSPPARASLRLAKAWARASSSETSGKLPRPISPLDRTRTLGDALLHQVVPG